MKKYASDISTPRTLELKVKEERQEKARICFGSGLERKTLESDTRGLVSKHARTHLKENYPDLGPGSYEVENKTSLLSTLMKKPTSKLGTVLGGRRAEKRQTFLSDLLTPAPGNYQIPRTFSEVLKPACAPFNTSASRESKKTSNIPGVGMYNLRPYRNRKAAFAHSFGGKRCLMPAVKMKCRPYNFDTCERCKKFPEGDYWSLDNGEVEKGTTPKKSKVQSEGVFLCRSCYELEKKENKMFTSIQIRNFKKIRDCSRVHFHNGCKAKLFLVPPQEIAKLKERESYLALYFN